jgi:hypothetical protein
MWRALDVGRLPAARGAPAGAIDARALEEHNEDSMYTQANAIAVQRHERDGFRFESGVFDVVLRHA